jgi:hypothetical protein
MSLKLNFATAHTNILNDMDLVSTLHQHQGESEVPISISVDHAVQYLEHLKVIGYVFVTTTLVFCAILAILRSVAKSKSSQNQSKKMTVIAYQITNLCVNLILGLYGLYHYNMTLPSIPSLLITHRITGFQQYANFACLQIGYNLWSLPVGYFLINESKAMLCHHIATICVSSISGFGRTGFRYHAPFFFGLIEISSVPLSIMNYCKNNQEWTKQNCPNLGAVIRPIFAVTFLTTRVFMWTPNILDVLRGCVLLFLTSTDTASLSTKIVLGLFTICVVFLTALQYYWGVLIVKGIVKLVAQVRVKATVKEVKIE